MNLFLDDTRPAPPGWHLVRTCAEAIEALRSGGVVKLSLDRDLGRGPHGDVVCSWMIETDIWPAESISIHSSNRREAWKMAALLESAGWEREYVTGPFRRPDIRSFRHLVERAASPFFLLTAPTTALYVSAGHDTGPLTWLQRGRLDRAGIPEAPAPNLIVMVDKTADPGPLEFADGRTTIRTVRSQQISFMGWDASILSLEHRSKGLLDAGRRVSVVRIKALNDEVIRAALKQRWAPEVVIGVKDGCAYGGNRVCSNLLTARSPLARLVRSERVRWWVTDHFKGVAPASPDEPFSSAALGFEVVRRAVLSRLWGFRWPPYNATAMFEIVHPAARA